MPEPQSIQSRIGAWHQSVYGPSTPKLMDKLWRKIGEERAELGGAYIGIEAGLATSDDFMDELADNMILLYELANRYCGPDSDLAAAVEAKFAIVSTRDQAGRDAQRETQ